MRKSPIFLIPDISTLKMEAKFSSETLVFAVRHRVLQARRAQSGSVREREYVPV
jgi:predicted PolB exonuclease-like 3'-5' exonuclease